MSIMEIQNIKYSYDGKRIILSHVSAEFEVGKVYAILGPSGCGKTTLLSLLGGLDIPSDGRVLFQGEDIENHRACKSSSESYFLCFSKLQSDRFMTPAENVTLTSKKPPMPILKRLGLSEEESKRNVMQLSGGQQQRIAIARALASDAKVILADEPTGNLDEGTAAGITDILKETTHQLNKCVVIVTHSGELANQADVVLKLKKGELMIEKSV